MTDPTHPPATPARSDALRSEAESQRDYRLSLTLARRVVRRTIELERLFSQRPAPVKPAGSAMKAPPADPSGFQCSMRVIQRVMRRVSQQDTPPSPHPADPVRADSSL